MPQDHSDSGLLSGMTERMAHTGYYDYLLEILFMDYSLKCL